MGKRFLLLVILLGLPNWQARASKVPFCMYSMAYLNDEEGSIYVEDFIRLGPIKRLRYLAKKPSFIQVQLDLDEPYVITVDRERAIHLYNFILNLWPTAEMKNLGRILENIDEDHIADKRFISALKATRLCLKSLRSAAIALSYDHEASEDLDQLIVIMGKIKDSVENQRLLEAASFLKEFKRRFSANSRESIKQQINQFRPDSKTGFAKWFNEEINDIRIHVREKKIEAWRFHNFRKFVSHLATLFRAIYSAELDTDVHHYFNFLESLDTRMGDFNDYLVKNEIEKRVEIPDEIRKGLKELTRNLKAGD